MSELIISSTIPFHQQILQNAKQYGNDSALTDHSGTITYDELNGLANRYANALSTLGINKGSNVLLILGNCKEYPLIFLGSALLGATISGGSVYLTVEEIEYLCKEADSGLVITDSALDLGIETKVITLAELQEMAETRSDEFLMYPDTDLQDVLIEPFSSGTTGHPKCVQLTHQNYIAATKALSEALFSKLTGKGRRCTLAFLPFYHGSGFWALVYCLLAGHHSVIMSEFHPLLMLEAIEKHQVDVINVVPSIVSALVRLPNESFDLSSLEVVLCGSAPLGKELCQAFMAKFPQVTALVQGYGMTEIVVLSHILPMETEKEAWGSCGKLLPGFEAKLINVDGEIVEERGAWGELFLKSEAIFKGYKGGQDSGKDEDGWLASGDIAYQDVHGLFYIVDRKKDLIKVNGMQVAPVQLESVLLTHPKIAEAAVIRTSHEQYGEVPKAFLVPTDGCSIDPKEIHDFMKEHVAPFKQLRGGIVIREELPKTKSGKIARNLLK
ncbi:unnamed protein product, partial [Mesorhabditis spiculigera]